MHAPARYWGQAQTSRRNDVDTTFTGAGDRPQNERIAQRREVSCRDGFWGGRGCVARAVNWEGINTSRVSEGNKAGINVPAKKMRTTPVRIKWAESENGVCERQPKMMKAR